MDKRPQIIKDKLESTLFFNVTIHKLHHGTILSIEGTKNMTERERYMIELEGNLITLYICNNLSGNVEHIKIETRTEDVLNYIILKERKTILKNVKNLFKKVDKLD
ncbi:hypothetical protein GA-1p50 [Bacillus phage GA1]|uniref:Uncharacterized protein n=1 Tax=Bacillus phage GA-1 TaxID=2679898 RepID=Q9FZU8_BPGA1|nr:hypothetical protein GA-1p50 [Bacillus phage GA1]CAC21548.1 hypothetical protein [Bacillus phage GA1]